jgi:hypothetical protein
MASASYQGLTLVNFSAQRKGFLRGYIGWLQSCGLDWWVISRHKLDSKSLTDQNGLG